MNKTDSQWVRVVLPLVTGLLAGALMVIKMEIERSDRMYEALIEAGLIEDEEVHEEK